jgi:hypothetical protein
MANKTILVVADGESSDYEEDVDARFGDGDRVIVKEIDPTSADKLRGYNADLIVLTCSVSAEVMQRVLEPMVAIGGEIIQLQ